MDDVLSFLVTIGSPALAAYSLQITHLNARWITKAFLDVNYPNSKDIPIVLSAFHHVPIRISHGPHLYSLIILPRNNGFWRHLLTAAKKIRRWSIPLGMSFVLVTFAAILTVLDSFYSQTPRDIGYAITATWTFLLPLIIGWLHVGCEPEPNHLRDSLEMANLNAWVATARRDNPMRSALAIEFMKAEDVDPARTDELKTVPVFNYSRAFVTPSTAEMVLASVKNAAANAEQRIPVGNPTGRGPPAWAEGGENGISDENRIGTVAEVTRYCTEILPQLEPGSNSTTLQIKPGPSSISPQPEPGPSPTAALEIKSSEESNTLIPFHTRPVIRNPSRWATGIWKRVTLASALGLGLQWGTVGAAVLIHYVTPPVGLGCRALSFTLYGAAGTTSFFLFLASSILAQMSRLHEGQEDVCLWLRTCQNAGAIVCRWLGKCIAILSAMCILIVCFFQVTDAFNNCFCASTTFDKGRDSVVFQTINSIVGPSVLWIWIGGLGMAVFTIVAFGFAMYLATPPRR